MAHPLEMNSTFDKFRFKRSRPVPEFLNEIYFLV